MSAVRELLQEKLRPALSPEGRGFFEQAAQEIARRVEPARFAELFSLASRYAPRASRGGWIFSAGELESADELVPGWNPERWTALECLRALLVLQRPDLERASGAAAVEELFRYADVGELCAAYRTLPLLPDAARFTWRAGEGCRSSMSAVFESVACDSPFPARHFDDLAWRQMLVKCLFVGAPLWRVVGLDGRLDAEVARMALDLAEERRSAGRPVPPDLWLLVAKSGEARATAALERELANGPVAGRRAAVLALARVGSTARLAELARTERDPLVQDTLRAAREGRHDQRAWAALSAP
jgi:hypothetical protein